MGPEGTSDPGIATADSGTETPVPPATEPSNVEPPEETIGPPLTILALGALAAVGSIVLLLVDSTATHVVGYLCGSLIPILAIGLFRRVDLTRRKSPLYQRGSVRDWMIPAVAIVGLLAAALHTWALATRLAS